MDREMKDGSAKLTVAGDGDAEQPHINEASLLSEHDENTKSKDESPPLDQKNVGGGSLLGHPTSDVSNATPEEVTNKDYAKIRLGIEQAKFKRIMLNRLSAQRSRMKRVKYVMDLENYLKELEAMVSGLSPLIEQEKQEQLKLRAENSFLAQKLDTYYEMSVLKNAQLEKTRAEIEKLKEMQLKRINQQQEKPIMGLGLGLDTNGLDEITTAGFYLESGPSKEGGLELMLGLNTSATKPAPDSRKINSTPK